MLNTICLATAPLFVLFWFLTMPVLLQYGAFQSSPCRLVVWGQGWARQPWTECLHKWANLAAFQRAGRVADWLAAAAAQTWPRTQTHHKSYERKQNLRVQWAMLANYQGAKMQKEISLSHSYGSGGYSIPRHFSYKVNKWIGRQHTTMLWKTEAVLRFQVVTVTVSLAWLERRARGTAPANRAEPGHNRPITKVEKRLERRQKAEVKWDEHTDTHSLCQSGASKLLCAGELRKASESPGSILLWAADPKPGPVGWISH